MKRYLIYINILAMALMGITSCSDVEFFDSEDEIVSMTYTIGLGDDVQGRAIGDGNNVDRLYVGVYEEDEEVKRIEGNISNREAQITIELFKNRTYNLVFWAQSSQTDVYDLTDLRNISVTYPETMTLQKAARMDAFFLLKEDVTLTEMGMDGGELTLKRPFAQLNIAASEEDAPERIKKAVLTVQYGNEEPLVLTYTDFTVEEGDKVTNNEVDYYYVATAFLKPGIISGEVVLYDDSDKEIKSFDLNQSESLELKANHRYNVLGDMITQEELPGWDGVFPTESPLTQDEQNRYVVDEEMDLAWLSQNASSLSENSTFIVTKEVLDMGNHSISSIQLPVGSTFDGGGKTIKNFANSLFGDATNITVQNLNLDGITASSDSHVGVLVNTLTGNGTFSEITIQNSKSETMNGAAGGMIGYIVRASEKERSEQLEVMIENCSISKTVITDSSDERYEGLFVGLLSGYDNGEKLTFMNCTATEDIEVPDIYNDFLGNETYCRGLVMLNEERFMPKWDGTSIEPLLANPIYDGENAIAGANKFVVYSPFDLAGVRKKTASPAAIYLKADIDMNGQGNDDRYNVPNNFTQSAYTSTDDKVFTPFNYVTTLDGYKDENENYSIYNLNIAQIEQESAAFILYASGTTTHKNINFRNCQTVAVHKPVETDAKAYGAILVSNVDATYTMENVHAYDCKVFALQKVGTLGARINGTSTLTNNSVNNCYVENYECKINERFSSGEKKIASWTVTVYADFYPHGEVGGMYGFIQGNSTLINCKVNGTVIYAFGQDDKMATTSGSLVARLGIAALGYYKVPGRHVSTLIGNIRATGTVTLSGCVVDTNTKCTKSYYKHNSIYNYIGQAYIVKFVDSEGTVTVDGKKLTLADCNKNTKL